jgi:DNA mismatch repair protein MSH2
MRSAHNNVACVWALSRHTMFVPRTRGMHVLLQVRDVASTYVQVWEVVGELLAELDVLASFADVASSSPAPFVRPAMLGAEAGEIKLVSSRHPCLELQDGIDVIANDCEMKRGSSWFQLVTGPNMGGKSTYIRQVCSHTWQIVCLTLQV